MVNCFIEIRKSDLLRSLEKMNIKAKYREAICLAFKDNVTDSIEDFLLNAIKQTRIIEGQETLEQFTQELVGKKFSRLLKEKN